MGTEFEFADVTQTARDFHLPTKQNISTYQQAAVWGRRPQTHGL
jgi:hypothetical protein